MKPHILIYRPLPDDVVAYLAEHARLTRIDAADPAARNGFVSALRVVDDAIVSYPSE